MVKFMMIATDPHFHMVPELQLIARAVVPSPNDSLHWHHVTAIQSATYDESLRRTEARPRAMTRTTVDAEELLSNVGGPAGLVPANLHVERHFMHARFPSRTRKARRVSSRRLQSL
jgi:hypothetical protein